MIWNLLLPLLASASSSGAVQLPDHLAQGDLVLGRTQPGSEVVYGDRSLRVDDQGRFVFGLGRDEAGPVSLVVKLPDGTSADMILDLDSNIEQQIELFLLSNSLANDDEARQKLVGIGRQVQTKYNARTGRPSPAPQPYHQRKETGSPSDTSTAGSGVQRQVRVDLDHLDVNVVSAYRGEREEELWVDGSVWAVYEDQRYTIKLNTSGEVSNCFQCLKRICLVCFNHSISSLPAGKVQHQGFAGACGGHICSTYRARQGCPGYNPCSCPQRQHAYNGASPPCLRGRYPLRP